MANVFDQMGNYWAEIADKSHTEEQIQFLKKRLKPDGYVLDLACGTGRHLIGVGSLGFKAVGLDVSIKLLKIAKQREQQVQVVRGDLRFLPFKSGVFAAVVSMDTSLGYLPSKKSNQQILAEVRRAMSKGSVLIVDVFNRSKLMAKNQTKPAHPKWQEYPSFYLKQKRTLSSSDRRIKDLWVVRDKATGQVKRFRHSVQLFSQDELGGLLKAANFVVEEVLGSYEGEFFSESSPRLILVALAK